MSNLAAVFFQSLIVCSDAPSDFDSNGVKLPPCDFAALIKLAQVIMNDIIALATITVVIFCIYIGFQLMFSGGSTTVRNAVKGQAWQVLKGFLWILTAWVVVYAITSTLANPGFSLISN